MQDQYIGKAGTFIFDPVKGIRVPIEQYEAEQAQSNTDKKTEKLLEKPSKEHN